VFQVEVGRITFIYWPIECTPKALFVIGLQLGKTTFIYWPIVCTPKASFVWGCLKLKELPSSIGQWNALQ
jgi:hypothetical protein